MIETGEYVLYLTRRASARRVSLGETVRVLVGRSRLVGRISYVNTTNLADHRVVILWVRVPMIDVMLPEFASSLLD